MERRRQAVLPRWPVTTIAVLLFVAAGIALDFASGIASGDDLSPREQSRIAHAGASSLHAQPRVRPSSSHRLQLGVSHAALPPPAVTCSGDIPHRLAPAMTNRQRLARLTNLRI